MHINIPDFLPWVFLVVVLIQFLCMITGFVFVGRERKRSFTDDFMNNFFADIHSKEFGPDEPLPRLGFPDNGCGLYAKRLPYKNWYTLNNAMRMHMNQVEMLPIVLVMALYSAYGSSAASLALCIVYLLARIIYKIGYSKGPNYRRPGAILIALTLLGFTITSIYTVATAHEESSKLYMSDKLSYAIFTLVVLAFELQMVGYFVVLPARAKAYRRTIMRDFDQDHNEVSVFLAQHHRHTRSRTRLPRSVTRTWVADASLRRWVTRTG